MKTFLVNVGFVALAIFIVGTLVLGTDANSMRSTVNQVNADNATNMSEAGDW